MALKIEVTDKPPQNLGEMLTTIFWKEPEVAKIACDFLQTIKEWSRSETPYTVDQWKQYITRHEITQSTYHNMLKRLRLAGMIEKVYNKGRGKHELRPSKKFSDVLSSMHAIWDNYLKD
jgi:hypothetical protein